MPRSKKKKKRWEDLSSEQRAGVLAAGVVQVSLLGAALLDLARRPSSRVNGSKALWAAVSFVNFVGPIAYFRFGRKRG